MASASSNTRKYIKLTFYLKRLPDCTDEKFHQYWAENHAQVAMQHAVFNKVVRRYNQVRSHFRLASFTANEIDPQYHIPDNLKVVAAKMGLPTLDYDGVAELWVDSLESWMEVANNIDFVKAIAGEFKARYLNCQRR
jgi:hypothetical protein